MIYSESIKEEASHLGCNADVIIKSILTNGANNFDFVDAKLE
jgi:hypothetical protein